ncbi:MAG: flagellar basal body L-ring protein FlgH [Pseudomonadales bacterium]|jgi:flagellar L-ring protein precursor FlgH|nr:flagellar basal body L-ring protein FlgH [Pseudomonadales bacterium]
MISSLSRTRTARLAALLVGAQLLAACTSVAPPYRGRDFAATAPLPARSMEENQGGLYQEGHALLLFEDAKARYVGDTITVILRERTDATKRSSASAGKSSAFAAGASGYLDIDDQAIDSSVDFEGTGAADQRNELNGRITVTIAEVLPNGNLVVRGEKWIGINQGREYIQLDGIVRPEDVRPDNTVLSERVANAYITYGGDGMVADTTRAGFLTRFFQSPAWPF